MTGGTIHLLLIGVSDAVANLAVDRLAPSVTKRIVSETEFMEFLDDPESSHFHIAVVGADLREVQVIEIAQSLRGIMVEAPIYYAHEARETGFDRKNYIKNGFTDAFLFPIEAEALSDSLNLLLAVLKKTLVFRPVRIMDIQADEVLDFDVHLLLPANQKYIKYISAGQKVNASKVEKLKSFHHQSVFVPLEQMAKFYSYSAAKLKTLSGETGAVSETERHERLQTAVRELVTGIFSSDGDVGFEEGKRMMADAGEIVKSYIAVSNASSFYERLQKVVGESSSFYTHLTNVSTIAAIFSLATGVGKPEDLAIAGLFHDIGLAMVPAEIQMKPESEWTEEERKIYYRHPEHSLNLIKSKKIVLSPDIQTMILQHHERSGGRGYPQGLSDPKLKKESQLLAIADEFDELTKFEMGKSTFTPEKAIQIIKEKGGFSLDLLLKIAKIFSAP